MKHGYEDWKINVIVLFTDKLLFKNWFENVLHEFFKFVPSMSNALDSIVDNKWVGPLVVLQVKYFENIYKTEKRALHAQMSHSTVCNTTVSTKKIRHTLVKQVRQLRVMPHVCKGNAPVNVTKKYVFVQAIKRGHMYVCVCVCHH